MKDKKKRDVFFALYLVMIAILATIYFTVPERKEFFEFQLQWWGEFRDALLPFKH
jgi:hypothetical protein